MEAAIGSGALAEGVWLVAALGRELLGLPAVDRERAVVGRPEPGRADDRPLADGRDVDVRSRSARPCSAPTGAGSGRPSRRRRTGAACASASVFAARDRRRRSRPGRRACSRATISVPGVEVAVDHALPLDDDRAARARDPERAVARGKLSRSRKCGHGQGDRDVSMSLRIVRPASPTWSSDQSLPPPSMPRFTER